MRRPILILLGIAAVAIAVLTAVRLHGGDGQPVAIVEDTPAPTRTPDPLLVVYVAGAVAHPGVYRLAAGARIVDALLAAGGVTGGGRPCAPHQAPPDPGRPRNHRPPPRG